eukprot:CAMPEP_0119096568 /NCGR_PEP_ID=MMETSP1178-20130426/173283_1 /TAXON_ID=33656 /ORGANISM="unid sp, Strain CCMP2000" /LENGTH=244 /DNA_ID=CAMNT_0007080457 /DNA_START=18 /DNA_END=752 /DNA_ORIENTATION=+
MAFVSTTNAPGTRAYTSVVCENNWFEERARLAAGERVYIPCMEGAYLRPEDPDLSIAPPTRDPGVPSDGKLVMPHRSYRSRVTNDSSRQGADDGFREYASISGTDYCPIEQRGNAQTDDLRKTRSATVQPLATTARVANREKNAMLEQFRISDGEAKMVQKMLGTYHTSKATFETHASRPRPSREAVPGKVGYGCTVPRHAGVYKNDFQTTSRHDFTGTMAGPEFPDGLKTAAIDDGTKKGFFG